MRNSSVKIRKDFKNFKAQSRASMNGETVRGEEPQVVSPDCEFNLLPYCLPLAKKLNNVHLAVLMELGHVHYKKQINPVPLSNKNLEEAGFSRKSKMKALAALQNVGLVGLKQIGNQCVQVRLFWQPLKLHSKWENAST